MILRRLQQCANQIRRRALDPIGGYRRRYLVEADLVRLAELEPPSGVEIRPFNGPDWSLMGDMVPGRLTGQFDDAAAAGRTCLVAWKRRQAVGYAWFSTKIESRHERYDLPLPSDAVYIQQIEVSPNERRQGLAAALLSAGLRIGRDRGFHRSWIILDPMNAASIRTIASVAPSRVLGIVRRLRLLGWMRCRYRALHMPVRIEPLAG
jgi:ribosomal protein S18 acetylase RimI-like enzyme